MRSGRRHFGIHAGRPQSQRRMNRIIIRMNQ
jgi:hypothetical protein